MSIAVLTGARSLVQLGVSLGDVAVILRVGRIWGNWLRAAENDNELFESILETPGALLKRRDLVDPMWMKSRWSRLDFMYQGRQINNGLRSLVDDRQEMSMFSWVMVVIVTALDVCLPSSAITTLLVEVFMEVLDGDKDMGDSIAIQLPTNIRSWRNVGCVRGMVAVVNTAIRKCKYELVRTQAVAQINVVERGELKEMLIWLLAGQNDTREVVSVTNYAVAKAMREAGLHLSTGSDRRYEKEPVIRYAGDPRVDSTIMQGSIFFANDMQNGRMKKAQVIAYPRGSPSSMIETVAVSRATQNRMVLFWKLGAEAGTHVTLKAEVILPFSSESDIWYVVEGFDVCTSRFTAEISLQVRHGFPVDSQSSFIATEELLGGVSQEQRTWLHTHTGSAYLQRTEFAENSTVEYPELLAQFQALIFGFYYKLFEPMVLLTNTKQSSYFRGSWGTGGTHFLSVCAQFADELRLVGKVSRSHILHMLSTMFDGRDKIYSPQNSAGGLLGILGNTSVLSNCLLYTSDVPSELARFHIVDLPFADLLSDAKGELYASHATSIRLFASSPSAAAPMKDIVPRSDAGQWSVHPRMGLFSGEDEPGIVMAARRSGKLVGYFSPLAADFAFTSSCYQPPGHEGEEGYVDEGTIMGIEVREDHRQQAILPRPAPAPKLESVVLAVHSRGCPAMRYAAAGFFTGAREEVAIATDDIHAAVGRIEGTGVVIA